MPDIPETLVEDICAGRCVAFVGAGFSASAGLPDWRRLLGMLCERLPRDFVDPASGRTLDLRRDLLRQGGYDPRTAAEREREEAAAAEGLAGGAGSGSSSPLPPAGAGLSPDMFASLLKNTFDYVATHTLDEARRALYDFQGAMRHCLQVPGGLAAREDMRARLNALRALPLRGIITTNFDGMLLGRTPFDWDIRSAYHALLRPAQDASAEGFGGEHDCPLEHRAHRPIIQLHGRVGKDWQAEGAAAGAGSSGSSAHAHAAAAAGAGGAPPRSSGFVFAKAEYNSAVHGNPVNKAFLQSVFSTCTILFLGFSFTDSYVDGLLDETFHLFSRGEGCGT